MEIQFLVSPSKSNDTQNILMNSTEIKHDYIYIKKSQNNEKKYSNNQNLKKKHFLDYSPPKQQITTNNAYNSCWKEFYLTTKKCPKISHGSIIMPWDFTKKSYDTSKIKFYLPPVIE